MKRRIDQSESALDGSTPSRLVKKQQSSMRRETGICEQPKVGWFFVYPEYVFLIISFCFLCAFTRRYRYGIVKRTGRISHLVKA